MEVLGNIWDITVSKAEACKIKIRIVNEKNLITEKFEILKGEGDEEFIHQ